MPSPAPANVRVVVRVRPLNDSELSLNGTLGRTNVVSLECKSNVSQTAETIAINCDSTDAGGSSSAGSKHFTFDAVHGPKSSQIEVFESVQEIVEAVTSGYNGTIVAYGQTGSGKSFTVFGNSVGDDQSLGLVQRSLRAIFDKMSSLKRPDVLDESYVAADSMKTEFRASFLEIFNDRVYDLLSSADALEIALSVREDARGVFVDGLKEVVVSSAEEAETILRSGIANRHVASTNMNRASSRSHAVFTLNIRSEHTTSDGLQKIRLSKFTLVDLAGSERQKKTAVLGERLKEASMINKSLLCLGHVINALVDREAGRERHIPFRDSKLTFLLRDSWGGNSKTCLIATISPSAVSMSETLSTLSFAQRAKLIKNTAILNEDTCGSIAALQAEVLRLRSLLQNSKSSASMASELTEDTNSTEDGFISSFRRQADRAEQRASLLENEITEQKEVIHTLKRKLDEAVMARKFKERRIEYFQKKNDGIEMDEHVTVLQNEINLLRNELDKPSISAIHWKAECERLKEEVARKNNDDVRIADTYSEEVAKLDHTIQRLIREKDDYLRSIEELTQSSSEAQEEIDVLLHEIDRLEAELSSVQRKLSAREIRLEDAEAELIRFKSLVDFQKEDSLEKEKASFIIHNSVQIQLLEKEKELFALKNDLEKNKIELRDLDAEKYRLDKENASAINNLEAVICSLQNQVAERESLLTVLSASDAVQEDVRKLTAELVTVREDSALKAAQHDHEYRRISSKLEEQQINLIQSRDEITMTKASLSTLNCKMNMYAKDLADVVNGIIASARDMNIESGDIHSTVSLCDESNDETIFFGALTQLKRSVSMLFSSLCSKNLDLSLKKDEIARMQREILSQQRNVSNIHEENLKHIEQILSLQDALRLKENEEEMANATHELEVHNLKDELTLSIQEIDSLKDQILRFNSELDDLQSLFASSNKEIADLKTQLCSCEYEKLNLRTTIENLQGEQMRLVSSYEEKYSQMASVIVDQEQQLIERGRAQKMLTNLEADFLRAQSEYSNTIHEYQNTITSLQNDLVQIREMGVSTMTEADQGDVKNLVDQLHTELKEKDDYIKIVNERLVIAEEKVRSLTTELSDLGSQYENRLNTIQAKGESTSKTVSRLEDRITLLKREKGSLTTELDKFINEVQTLNERVEYLERENASLKQESSSRSESNSTDERDGCSVKSEIPSYDSACYSALSDEMDVFLSRLTSSSSAQSKDGHVDESMDESLFLPNNDVVGALSSFSKENNDPKDDCGMETPMKKDYGARRQPLSDLKQSVTTPVTSHKMDPKLSTKKKLQSGNKHRSNWMIYDNTKIFDR